MMLMINDDDDDDDDDDGCESVNICVPILITTS